MVNIFKKSYCVNWGDMDIDYRLTRTCAIKYFQETFALYCAKHNLAAFDLDQENLIWVIPSLNIVYSEDLPYWSEVFDVEIWVSEKTKIRTRCDFRICNKNNETIAKGFSHWYLLDKDTRRPVKSDKILNALEIKDEKIFEQNEKKIYNFDGDIIAQKKHQVTVRDLDFNYHVNNLSYIGFGQETIPSEIMKKNKINAFCIKFLKEAYLDDVLVCEMYENSEEYNIKIYDEKTKVDVCYIAAKYSPKTNIGRNPREAGVVFN